MSQAIFWYTLLIKMRSLPVLFTVLFFCVIMPFGFSLITGVLGTDLMSPFLLAIIQSASIPLVIAFVVQKDAFADTRNLSDGEYLALLFTRPVTRAEYVISKWVATASCVAASLYLQMLVFHVCQAAGGRDDGFSWNPYRAVDIILQALSAAGVVSVINAVPRRLGVWLFMVLSYSALLVQVPLFEPVHSTDWFHEMPGMDALQIYALVINALLSNKISTYELFLSNSPDWGALVSFISNISLYLLFAIYLLNRREFFYASE